MENYEKLVELVAENLGVDQDKVNENSDLFEDLNADSLDLVELTMAIEDEFDVEIEDDNLDSIKTVKDILNYINGK
ncbi:acyl carrier protein [Atopobacter sp. AH10]|uniref:acyl carrier protein n=1 Tax=Atopobacter sp. AH10 TaxID=2315861 RepID=UPI000EF22513|nr:acyl carrier protein [Atopobacter sp. AH10]RLK63049.1 acyl carrier protein [Atopobacter sp. AH10]